MEMVQLEEEDYNEVKALKKMFLDNRNRLSKAEKQIVTGGMDLMMLIDGKSLAKTMEDIKIITDELENLRTEVFTSLNNFKSYAEQSFEKMVNEKPNARNTTFYTSYLRSTNQYQKALIYADIAHNLAPRKQMFNFEYVTVLAANGQNAKAIEIAKMTAESEPTYTIAQNLYSEMLKSVATTTKKK